MYGLTRATITLLGAGVAGLLIWIGTQIGHSTNGGYWGVLGLVAAAGFVMALSQLLGGWTKWGWPRVSGSVLLLAFIRWSSLCFGSSPTTSRTETGSAATFRAGRKTSTWEWARHDLSEFLPVLAFGAGLVFGYSFDTTGPAEPIWRRRRVAGAGAAPTTTTAEAERRVEIREGGETTSTPPAEPPPRAGEPPPEGS